MAKIQPSNLILTCQHLIVAGLKYLVVGGLVLFTFTLSLPVHASGLIGNENQIIKSTNQIRTVRGIQVLTRNALLDESAQNKAEDMASKGYFNHADQDGNRMSYWMGLVGYDYLRAGENLAKGFSTSEAVVQAWLNSPTHYANMVNSNYIEIGIGIASGILNGQPTIFVVQHYGQPMPQFAISALFGGSVMGDDITKQSLTTPPSTGGNDVVKDYDLITEQPIRDNILINSTPKGLLFVAYEGMENTNMAVTQAWRGVQTNFPELPYVSDLPQDHYQLIQVLVVLGWFAGAAWIIYRSVAPVLTWLKHKPNLVIKLPIK